MISINREEIITNLISNINAACKERNMSINEFCHCCNIHKSVMDNLKRKSVPAVEIIAKMAIFLDSSVDELIGLNEYVRNK